MRVCVLCVRVMCVCVRVCYVCVCVMCACVMCACVMCACYVCVCVLCVCVMCACVCVMCACVCAHGGLAYLSNNIYCSTCLMTATLRLGQGKGSGTLSSLSDGQFKVCMLCMYT